MTLDAVSTGVILLSIVLFAYIVTVLTSNDDSTSVVPPETSWFSSTAPRMSTNSDTTNTTNALTNPDSSWRFDDESNSVNARYIPQLWFLKLETLISAVVEGLKFLTSFTLSHFVKINTRTVAIQDQVTGISAHTDKIADDTGKVLSTLQSLRMNLACLAEDREVSAHSATKTMKVTKQAIKNLADTIDKAFSDNANQQETVQALVQTAREEIAASFVKMQTELMHELPRVMCENFVERNTEVVRERVASQISTTRELFAAQEKKFDDLFASLRAVVQECMRETSELQSQLRSRDPYSATYDASTQTTTSFSHAGMPQQPMNTSYIVPTWVNPLHPNFGPPPSGQLYSHTGSSNGNYAFGFHTGASTLPPAAAIAPIPGPYLTPKHTSFGTPTAPVTSTINNATSVHNNTSNYPVLNPSSTFPVESLSCPALCSDSLTTGASVEQSLTASQLQYTLPHMQHEREQHTPTTHTDDEQKHNSPPCDGSDTERTDEHSPSSQIALNNVHALDVHANAGDSLQHLTEHQGTRPSAFEEPSAKPATTAYNNVSHRRSSDQIRVFRRSELQRIYDTLTRTSADQVVAWCDTWKIHVGNFARQMRREYSEETDGDKWFWSDEVTTAFTESSRNARMSHRVLVGGIRLMDGSFMSRSPDEAPRRNPRTAERHYQRRRSRLWAPFDASARPSSRPQQN